MQMLIGDENVARLQHALASPEVGDHALCLANQHHSRADVPGFESVLPKRIVTAGRYPGEIERRRTEAADAWRRRYDCAQFF